MQVAIYQKDARKASEEKTRNPLEIRVDRNLIFVHLINKLKQKNITQIDYKKSIANRTKLL